MKLNLSGKKFGRLTVIGEPIKLGKFNQLHYEARCDCGQTTFPSRGNLIKGTTKSCGCLFKEKLTERNLKHGHSVKNQISRTYNSWAAMRTRCDNENSQDYSNYGGGGRKYQISWANFENFLADKGECPVGRSLDRIDNNGDYTKENTRWATPKEQANNTRRNTFLTFQGKTQTVAQWTEELGVSRDLIRGRLSSGWAVERALTEKVH